MIITLCGSKRFADEIYSFANNLRKMNNTVYCPMFNSSMDMNSLIQAHRYKIVASDLIIVCNYNEYIGDHTKNEIEFAKKINKPILFTDHLY